MIYSFVNKLCSLLLLFLLPYQLLAQEPFICTGDFYLSLSQNGGNSNLFQVEIDPITNNVNFNQFPNTASDLVNSLGYRISNNLIYGLNPYSFRLYIVDATGASSFQKQLDLNSNSFIH